MELIKRPFSVLKRYTIIHANLASDVSVFTCPRVLFLPVLLCLCVVHLYLRGSSQCSSPAIPSSVSTWTLSALIEILLVFSRSLDGSGHDDIIISSIAVVLGLQESPL